MYFSLILSESEVVGWRGSAGNKLLAAVCKLIVTIDNQNACMPLLVGTKIRQLNAAEKTNWKAIR